MNKIRTIYLASKSPRRYEILSRLGIDILLCPSDVEEITDKTTPDSIVCDLALLKIKEIASKHPDRLIITCDTIVWLDGVVLGKPKDESDACDMLRLLSGKIHRVYTGFAISYMGDIAVDYSMAQVRIKSLSNDEIIEYVESGSPMDKAGSYGIQDKVVAESFCGDYDTIVGMPLDKITNVIEKLLAGGKL